MGVADWLKRIAGVPEGAEQTAPAAHAAEDRGAEVGGLNFKSAVDAHMKWKVRLENYIGGTSDEDLQVDIVSCDDRCPLGKWIYSQGGSRFGYSETFFDMKAHHAHFHRCAGTVLAAAQRGDTRQALQLLHHGDYVRASERVKTLLAKLFVLVSDGQTALDSHVKWKARLRASIEDGSGEPIDQDKVARDDCCALGQWIAGVGSRDFGHLPAFAEMQARHAEFHRSAGEVLALARAGHRDEALRMLDEGDYARASDQLTTTLVDLLAHQPR